MFAVFPNYIIGNIPEKKNCYISPPFYDIIKNHIWTSTIKRLNIKLLFGPTVCLSMCPPCVTEPKRCVSLNLCKGWHHWGVCGGVLPSFIELMFSSCAASASVILLFLCWTTLIVTKWRLCTLDLQEFNASVCVLHTRVGWLFRQKTNTSRFTDFKCL